MQKSNNFDRLLEWAKCAKDGIYTTTKNLSEPYELLKMEKLCSNIQKLLFII